MGEALNTNIKNFSEIRAKPLQSKPLQAKPLRGFVFLCIMTKEDIFKEPLFPILNIQENGNIFLVTSVIRIKSKEDGMYYRTLLLRASKSNTPLSSEEKYDKIKRLITDGYLMCFLGKVDLLLRTINEDFVFYLDDNQEEESDRLKKL